MIKTILFDLDGTLLPMDQDAFVKAYFGTLAKKAAGYGYTDPDRLIKTIWMGTNMMIKNDGNKNNESVFWDCFVKEYGEKSLKDKTIFDDYYLNEFKMVQESCGYNSKAKETIDMLKNNGYRLVLATNPIFPSIATENRIRWAGLSPDDFILYTTYENSRYSKPNLEYYKDILTTLNCSPEECLMIGNDVSEDMVVSDLGMKTFLLTDCLINKNDKDISNYNKGNFTDLISYLKTELGI